MNKTLLAVVAALVIPTSSPTGTLGAWDRRQLPAITLDILAPPDIRDSLVERARAETNAIWEPAGITFNWRRIPSNQASARRHLEVTIDHARRGTSESQATLGWIRFTPDGPDSSIHLSVAAIEDLLLRTAGTGSLTNLTHEMVIGRALGRALSHELGHYLLRSKAHTSRGLMRAEWPSAEYFAFSRGGFQLSPGERNAAARRLQGDSHGRRALTYRVDRCPRGSFRPISKSRSGAGSYDDSSAWQNWVKSVSFRSDTAQNDIHSSTQWRTLNPPMASPTPLAETFSRAGETNTMDGVFLALIDERGDRPPMQVIETAAHERKPDRAEIGHRRREIQLAQKPRLDRLAIRGLHIEQVVRHQGADMVADHFIHDGSLRG